MTILNLLTTLATGLTAGVFFTWMATVVPGLGRLQDLEYLSAMQSINREIQNPFFFSCFFGALLLLPASTFSAYDGTFSLKFGLLLAAAILYIVGVFGLTVAGNVPLNNALDSLDLTALSPAQLSLQRLSFEMLWNNLNAVRAIASLLAFGLVLVVFLKEQ